MLISSLLRIHLFINPSDRVYVNNFESRLKGLTSNSFELSSFEQYVGGCIFVNPTSVYIHVENQLGFSASETIRYKQNFYRLVMCHGVSIDSYLSENGLFHAKYFLWYINEHVHKIHYCVVNVHHKNVIYERRISTVSECVIYLLLH